MWQRASFTLVALAFGIASHAADVQTDYDTEKDFSQFHYYQRQSQSDNIDTEFTAVNTDTTKELLSYSLDRQMAAASEKFPADFIVRLYIKTVKKLVDDRPRVGIGMGGFNNNMGGGVSFSFPLGGNDLDQDAQIIIDFLDPKTQQLLWRGSLTTRLSSKSISSNQKQLQKAFDAILKEFPPRK
jgi:hypothetical protein